MDSSAQCTHLPDHAHTPTTAPPLLLLQVIVTRPGNQVQQLSYRVVQASFGGPMEPLLNKTYALAAANPYNGCKALVSANGTAASGSMANTFVLMQRGDCYFTDKMQIAQASKAAGVLLTDSKCVGQEGVCRDACHLGVLVIWAGGGASFRGQRGSQNQQAAWAGPRFVLTLWKQSPPSSVHTSTCMSHLPPPRGQTQLLCDGAVRHCRRADHVRAW